MIKTAWITTAYNPTGAPIPTHATGPHYKRGELPAVIYIAIAAGCVTVPEICQFVQRTDQRVYESLVMLEGAGYVARDTPLSGRTKWSLIK